MSSLFRLLAIGSALTVAPFLSTRLDAREFTVMVYNVEHLIDLDGVALFEDYALKDGDPGYGPRKLLTKLQNIRRVLAHYNEGAGPEIILFNELELDNTPDSRIENFDAFLRANESKTVEELLSGEVPADARGWPSEAWLLKALEEGGLKGYRVSVARQKRDTGPREVGHKNVTFSRFPIVSSRTHATEGARAILETTVRIDGHELTVFNNHWKSGASDPETEVVRVGNAKTLRARMDEILAKDPNADLILGGDFNSQYNQSEANPNMPATGVNTVLGAQSNERATASANGPDVYNLWYELKPDERGSDTFRGQWGTLMQMMLTRGLYDHRGVQYVDNSFSVAKFPGLNMDVVSGTPIRWSFAGEAGGGFSDHFPITARFRIVDDGDATKFIATASTSAQKGAKRTVASAADLSLSKPTADLPAGESLQVADKKGQVYLVEGKVVGERPFTIEVRGERFQVFSHDRELRMEFWRAHSIGSKVRFHGRLGQYRGEWQFVLEDRSWWLR